MCILAFFTPSAIPGLTVGCLMFNITSGAALPLDFFIGSLATLIATVLMRYCRKITVKGYPFPAILFPVITNALLVGWELSVYIGEAFIINALCVAAGEAGVLLTFGSLLYAVMKRKKLDVLLFAQK